MSDGMNELKKTRKEKNGKKTWPKESALAISVEDNTATAHTMASGFFFFAFFLSEMIEETFNLGQRDREKIRRIPIEGWVKLVTLAVIGRVSETYSIREVRWDF
jgi:hypothetical protein